MQTFLPYSAFLKSAQVLDKKRCWKQVVEAKQILDCLERVHSSNVYNNPMGKSWYNHPAVRMWEGHIIALKEYFNAFLWVSKYEHKINTKYTTLETYEGTEKYPWWLGNENFHRAMRARLIEKDENFYYGLFIDDKGFNNGKYFWPVMDGSNTFKII